MRFSNGRITTNVILYNRGIPQNDSNFGRFVTVNYSMLKSLYRNNRQNGRPIFSFM